MRRPRALIAALAFAPLIAACTGAPPSGVASSEDALRGGVWSSASCGAGGSTLIQRAMNVGNFVAQTPEFQSCVATYYKPCSEDNAPNISSLLAATRSANATAVTCKTVNLKGGAGFTNQADEHGWSYSGTESIAIAQDFVDTAVQSYSANAPGGDFYEAFNIAAVIWHEVMHVHGYQHGDNEDADKAAVACGYPAGDPKDWFWRANAGNYAVESCLRGAYDHSGDRSGDATPTDGAPMQVLRKSIVEKGFADAHKRGNDTRRAAIFNAMMAGGYTLARFHQDVALNGIPSGATSVAVSSLVNDELFDSHDKDYFSISLAQPDRIMLVLLSDQSAAAPSLDYNGTGVRARVIEPGLSAVTLDLPAGQYLVSASASVFQTAPLPISLWVAELVPIAPTGCRGSMLCDGTVSFSCDLASDPLTLERLDGASWTPVDTENPIAGLDPELTDTATSTSATPEVRSYRVCVSSHSPTAACTAPMPISVERSQCPVGAVPPHSIDCSDQINWICNTLPDGTRDCHCGPYLPKVG